MAQNHEAAAQIISSPGQRSQSASPPGFEDFFRTSFRELVKIAMYAGATLMEAEDAASKTLAEMLPSWADIQQPLAYARRAVLHNFIKDKARGPKRVSRRLIERGWVGREDGVEDRQLSVWEDEEWVSDQLRSLPPAQREVMECVVAGLTVTEIAEVLGRTTAAVRRSLCDARRRLAPKLRQQHEQPRVPSSPREEAL